MGASAVVVAVLDDAAEGSSAAAMPTPPVTHSPHPTITGTIR